MGNSFLVTTAIPDSGLQLLSDAGTVTVLPEPPDYDTLAALCASGKFDVVLTQLRDVVDSALLAEARVRGVSNYAVGYNNIDVGAATRHGILVGNTPGVLTDATADIAMLLILGTAATSPLPRGESRPTRSIRCPAHDRPALARNPPPVSWRGVTPRQGTGRRSGASCARRLPAAAPPRPHRFPAACATSAR